jgi:hypothetical protein
MGMRVPGLGNEFPCGAGGGDLVARWAWGLGVPGLGRVPGCSVCGSAMSWRAGGELHC